MRGMVERDIASLLRDKAELDLRLRVGERCYGFLGARAAFDLARKEGQALQEQAENVATGSRSLARQTRSAFRVSRET